MNRLVPLLLLATFPAVAAPEQGLAGAEQEKPAIRDLGNGQLEIGRITIHQETRRISFPAEINMNDGLLEFAIVHQKGKIHESLLHTLTDPFNLNIALKLLRYEPSEELFQVLDDDYRPTGKFPEIPEKTRNAARVEILLSWKKDDGSTTEASLNDLITHTVSNKPLPPLPWVYGGSYIHNGSFQAKATGDIAALFTANTALFNYPGKDHELDDVWIPTPKRVPAVGTPVTVTIRPFSTAPPSKPTPR